MLVIEVAVVLTFLKYLAIWFLLWCISVLIRFGSDLTLKSEIVAMGITGIPVLLLALNHGGVLIWR